MSIADQDEFKELLQYPLMQALAHRRARRFPLGCHLPGKSELNYASEKAPLGLTELETAIDKAEDAAKVAASDFCEELANILSIRKGGP